MPDVSCRFAGPGEWLLVSPHRAKRPWQGEAAPPAPRTAYGLTKLMAEQAGQWSVDALGLDVVTLRLPLTLAISSCWRFSGSARWGAGSERGTPGAINAFIPCWLLQDFFSS